jgi:hypothetical protein
MTLDASSQAEPGAAAEGAAPAVQADPPPPAVLGASEPKPLVPRSPVQLSPKMRELLGRSPFRDPAMLIDAEALRGVLAAELRADSLLQLTLVDRLSVLVVEIRRLQSTVQTAVARKRLDAARDVLSPDFLHFYPPPPGVCKTTGTVATAYGEFMHGDGGGLAAADPAEVVAEALARLAAEGLDAPALDERAYVLALPEIERLEKIIASKQAELEALIEQALRLKDRRDKKAPVT